MLSKRRVRQTGRVRVSFAHSAGDARTVHVAGEFSDWKPVRMKRGPDGEWQAEIELEPNGAYEFRYVVDEREWVNDSAADRQVPNPFGGENSVVLT